MEGISRDKYFNDRRAHCKETRRHVEAPRIRENAQDELESIISRPMDADARETPFSASEDTISQRGDE